MGQLTVFTGPMFSGKTERLIQAIRRAREAELGIQVFAPTKDTRNGIGTVESHGGLSLQAMGISVWAVSDEELPMLAQRVRSTTNVVAIDEAQMFSMQLIGQVRALLRREL